MKRSAISDRWFQPVVIATFFVLLTAGLACAQANAGAAQGSNTTAVTQEQTHASGSQSEIRGTFPVLLTKSLDSKKLKVGDQVVCETPVPIRMENGKMFSTGTKVIGHVTQAQARSKGDAESSLGIAFDKIQLSKNEEIPIKGVLQAVGPSLGDRGPNTGPATGGNMGGSGQGFGGGGSHAAAATTAPPQAGTYGGYDKGNVMPILNKETTGVLGYKNLEMNDQHVITSTGKEVKLDTGSQVMIHVE